MSPLGTHSAMESSVLPVEVEVEVEAEVEVEVEECATTT
jgi:hypothetical protein